MLYYFMLSIFYGKVIKMHCMISQVEAEDCFPQFTTPILFTGICPDSESLE